MARTSGKNFPGKVSQSFVSLENFDAFHLMIQIIVYLDRAQSRDSNDIWERARRCVMAELEANKKNFRSKF